MYLKYLRFLNYHYFPMTHLNLMFLMYRQFLKNPMFLMYQTNLNYH
jgi:hypothetical protein